MLMKHLFKLLIFQYEISNWRGRYLLGIKLLLHCRYLTFQMKYQVGPEPYRGSTLGTGLSSAKSRMLPLFLCDFFIGLEATNPRKSVFIPSVIFHLYGRGHGGRLHMRCWLMPQSFCFSQCLHPAPHANNRHCQEKELKTARARDWE